MSEQTPDPATEVEADQAVEEATCLLYTSDAADE